MFLLQSQHQYRNRRVMRTTNSFHCLKLCIFRVCVPLLVLVPFIIGIRIIMMRRSQSLLLEQTDHSDEIESRTLATAPTLVDEKEEPRKLHFIYTIGCGGHSDSNWQLLQSNALDQSFIDAKQRGKLTRLVSGCVTDEKAKALMSQTIYSDLDIQFVPSQDKVGKKVYVQANRPFALLRYFSTLVPDENDTVYIVIDPDFIFRRALDESLLVNIKPGHYVSHSYTLLDPTSYAHQACIEASALVFNSSVIQPQMLKECERIKSLKSFRKYYAGVPYMLVRNDWLKLLQYWIPLIGPVLERYPGIESDMISWSLAASLCDFQPHLQSTFMATCMSSESASAENVLEKQMFLHLCQAYYLPEIREGHQYHVNLVTELPYIFSPSITKWFKDTKYAYVFNKHWLRRSLLLEDCGKPLLLNPPQLDAAQKDPHYFWHRKVIEEAIYAYNRAIVEFRLKVLHCSKQDVELLLSSSKQGLILHETHHDRFGGGWNHVIDL